MNRTIFSLIIFLFAFSGLTGCGTRHPLMIAAYVGDINTVKNILDSGTDINVKAGGETPICSAASSGQTEIVRLLLSRGADPNGAGGYSPIKLAALNGSTEMVQLLIQSGADINKKSYDYLSCMDALSCAAAKGHSDTIRVLLNAGAEISGNAIAESKDSGYTVIAKILEEEQIKRLRPDHKTVMAAQNKQVIVNASQGKERPLPSETKKPMSKHELSRSWAVIIGISQYQYSGQKGLTNLIFADDDAKSFVRSLHNLGWNDSHIKLLINEDATQRNITIALESWLTKAGPNDQIVLFWAGHGFPDPEDPEKVYFACYDTDISIPATGYRMDRVRKSLEERKSKNVILLADTCHAGKLITRGDGSRGISIVPNINKMVREQNIPKGWVFMVGADTDRQSIEHSAWSNGAFTHSLIKGLGGEADGYQSMGPKDNIVTMGELRAYMNTAMPDETQKVLGVAKHPVITTSSGDPDIWNLTLHVK